MNACEVKAHPIGCWQFFSKPWRRLFLAAFGLNLVVVAVLHDSLCRVIAALRGRLLCVILCVSCKVERFVLTTIKLRLLLSSCNISMHLIRRPILKLQKQSDKQLF